MLSILRPPLALIGRDPPRLVAKIPGNRATYLWMSGLRAKQGMRPLLAHEARPCSIYGEAVMEVGRRLVSRL